MDLSLEEQAALDHAAASPRLRGLPDCLGAGGCGEHCLKDLYSFVFVAGL